MASKSPARKREVPVQLRWLAHARSGDKGDTANVGLIALEPEYFPILVKQVTTARVQRHFKGMVRSVDRFALAQSQCAQFPAARCARRGRHHLAQDRRAGEGVLDGVASYDNSGPREHCQKGGR